MYRILFVSLVLSVVVRAQFSPGDLSNAHANLEGMSNCDKCHTSGDEVQNSKCLSCHTEINTLVNSGRGLHAREAKGKMCYACHSEHHGRGYKLMSFNQKGFDHGRAGYVLQGKHLQLSCAGCHQAKYIKGNAKKRAGRTFLGLEQNCLGCHTDVHKTTLGNNCTGCHTQSAFKPATGFSHAKTNFNLTGAHTRVDCYRCHTNTNLAGKDSKVFKGIQFASCTNCHKDIHNGKLGNVCTDCHSTDNFKNVRLNGFDHDKTGFKLLGQHRVVKCGECHGTDLNSKPEHKNCTNCHKDYHKGEFISTGKSGECSDCHTVNGFSPSLFTLELHQKTRFPLAGSHLAQPCQSCHYSGKEWKFKKDNFECASCHKNIHGEEISAKFMGNNNCSSCHNVENWLKYSFDHEKTEFKLTGKHTQKKCYDCHKKDESVTPPVRKFASLNTYCESCHKEVHNYQFKTTGENDCLKCHTTSNWKPEKFDHNNTRFLLTGAHSLIECEKCHKKAESNGVMFVKYKIEDFKCATCHF